MKVAYKLKKFFYKVAHLIELQLIMMLFSWPILLYWGLPLSIMSPISNIIFVPFLSLFILFSSFIFFTELLYLPNEFFIKILNFLSGVWLILLKQSSKFWLITCQYPGIVYIFFIPAFTIVIVYSKKLRSPMLKIPILISFITLCFISFNHIFDNNLEKDIFLYKKSILFIKKEKANIIIDHCGALNQTLCPFTLISSFIRSGAYNVDHLIIANPTNTCFQSIANLLDIIKIKNIYMPKFKSDLNQNGLKNWQILLEQVKKYNLSLYLIDQDTEIDLSINNSYRQKIIIKTNNNFINKNRLKYKKLNVTVT